jgi:hypothetical protein
MHIALVFDPSEKYPYSVCPNYGAAEYGAIVWTYGIRVFFRRVKNQVFLSIFDSKDRNTAKVRHAFFKIDNICA